MPVPRLVARIIATRSQICTSRRSDRRRGSTPVQILPRRLVPSCDGWILDESVGAQQVSPLQPAPIRKALRVVTQHLPNAPFRQPFFYFG